MTVEIMDNAKQQRFEMAVGEKIAFVNYKVVNERYLLTYAEVPPELNGQGYGSKLAQGVYETIRSKGAKATAICSFMVHYAARHPEVQTLLEK